MPFILFESGPCHHNFRSRDQPSARSWKILALASTKSEGRLVGAPYIPKKQRDVLWKSQGGSIGKEIRRLQREGQAKELAKLYFVSGDIDRAIQELELARQKEPESASTLNDLAVFYLAKGDYFPGLLTCMELLSRAIELNPNLDEARYNKAIVLEKMHLPREALQAWQEYRKKYRKSSWLLLARMHQQRVVGTIDNKWRARRPIFIKSLVQGNIAESASIVKKFSQDVRMYAEEELIALWADNTLDKRSTAAGDLLTAARKIGEMLAHHSGDRMLLDTMDGIAAAGSGKRNSGGAHRIAQGHQLFRRGIDLYSARRPDEALVLFDRSSKLLGLEGSPFHHWADFYSVLCEYYISDQGRVLRRLHTLRDRVGTLPYYALRGRIEWLIGLVQYEQGNFADALGSLNEALSLFRKLSEKENEAAIQNMKAICLARLDFDGSSWAHRIHALKLAEGISTPQRLHNIYGQSALAASRAGYPTAGLHFQNEVIDVVRTSGDPLLSAIAYLQRASLLADMNHISSALRDLQSAKQFAAMIPSEAQRETIRTDILLAEAKSLRSTPDRAKSVLALVIERDLGTNYRFRLPEIYYERATLANDVCGKSARADFSLGIKELERQNRFASSAIVNRPSLLLEKGLALYDHLIVCDMKRGNYGDALMYSERSRHLLIPGRIANRPDKSILHLLHGIKPGVAVIQFAVMGNRIAVWSISGGELRGELLNVPVDLAVQVQQFAHDVSTGAWEKDDAEKLFDILLGEFRSQIRGVEKLVIIPDKYLWNFPFGFLRSREDGCLFESHEIVSSPSLSWYIERSQGQEGNKPESIAVFGDPAFNPSAFNWLQRLPWAKAEAELVGSMYPRSEVRTGHAATKSSFVDGLSADVVMFAGHALDDSENPWNSILLLAPEGRQGDSAGVIRAHELLSAKCRASLVILAACTTSGRGSGKLRMASGWGHAFLAAGADNVLVSYSPLRDKSSGDFLARLNSRLINGSSPSAALRLAQLSFCRRSCSPADIRRWGAFGLIGS